jgi:hypothetical protein
MGFTKRYYTTELILSHIESGQPLKKYFNVDALIFQDDLSNRAYELYKNDKTDEEIKQFIIKELETKH